MRKTLHIAAAGLLCAGLLSAALPPEYSPVRIDYKVKGTDSTYLQGYHITLDGMNRLKKVSRAHFDRWGGLPGVKPDEICSANPAGFWRTGKYRGRHVMVDPDGNVAIIRGVNGVAPDRVKEASSPLSREEFKARWGNDDRAWATWAHELLVRNGFTFYSTNPKKITEYRNLISLETEDAVHGTGKAQRLSQVEIAYLLRTFGWEYGEITGKSYKSTEINLCALLFDPDYLSFIDKVARKAADISRGKPEFLGWYLDNEIQFRWMNDSKPGIWLRDWLVLDEGPDSFRANKYAKRHAQNFMCEKYGVEPIVANITPEMEDAYFYDVVRYYYKTTSEALRRNDPEHLIIGSRIHGYPHLRPEVVGACAEFSDLVSINVYHQWEPDDGYFIEKYSVWAKQWDRPFFVSEFYIRDATRTYHGQPYSRTGEGGGWYVKGQEDRGRFYQGFTRKLLTYPNCVGWQWFQMTDDYSAGYNGWNNKGLVSPQYEPYEDCLKYMKQMNENVYQVMDYYLRQ